MPRLALAFLLSLLLAGCRGGAPAVSWPPQHPADPHAFESPLPADSRTLAIPPALTEDAAPENTPPTQPMPGMMQHHAAQPMHAEAAAPHAQGHDNPAATAPSRDHGGHE